MRTAIVLSWLFIGIIVYFCHGCTANVQTGCENPSFESLGVSHRIMPSYIEAFGCETFEGMDSAGFSAFCAMEFPETEGSYASDVTWVDGRPCRFGEENCELFWICE